MVLAKPVKDPEKVTSYVAIGVLLVISQTFLGENGQFGFSERHYTIDQVYREVRKIGRDNISQAFDNI